MTDIPMTADATPLKGSLLVPDARTRRRNAAEARFKVYGIAAISLSLVVLAIMLFTIARDGAVFVWRWNAREVPTPGDFLAAAKEEEANDDSTALVRHG